MIKKILITALLVFAAGCGGGMYTSQSANPDESYQTPWGNVTITKDAFIFGSDYPSDIVIPDIEGMRDTAFVLSGAAPTGVLAIDLEAEPLRLSKKFEGMISPDGTGMPNSLHVIGKNRAFLLTSSHVVDFDPTSGKINALTNLLGKYSLPEKMPISDEFDIDGDGIKENSTKTLDMNFPAGITSANGKLYVTMSNLISPIQPAIAAPGMIRIFNILDSAPFLSETKNPIITTDFNPTALTKLPDGFIAVTNSGVSDIWDAAARPLTNSSIDIFDPETDSVVANISLGTAALSFQEIAATSDGARGYIGSASFGELYEIDFTKCEAVRSKTNPIYISGSAEGSDYLSSQTLSYNDTYLFVASFDDSAIYPIDISTNPPNVLPEVFNKPFILGFPKGVTAENPAGINTGIGAIATRPGVPETDYTGPDLFALTGSPGTIVTINTHGNEKGSASQITNMEVVPNQLKIDAAGGTIQFYLKVEFADGTVIDDAKDFFINPFSGFPVNVSWSSSDAGVANIGDDAKVTVKSAGETIISAKVGQRSVEATLIIEETETGEKTPNDDVNPDDKEEGANSGKPPNLPPLRDIGLTVTYVRPSVQEALKNITIQYDVSSNMLAVIKYLEETGYEGRNVPQNPPEESEMEILVEAPDGTDPFADAVAKFSPGPGAGFGQSKMPDVVLGPPKGAGDLSGSLDVVSLGKGGEIILEMTDFLIADGDGADFTVFENAFYAGGNKNNPFSEPGIVSVSEDGVKYFTFKCNLGSSPLYPGCAGTKPTYSSTTNGISPTDPDISGGNQFDLAKVGIKKARYVKIIDGAVGGSGGTTAGFDLDAVAVINGILP